MTGDRPGVLMVTGAYYPELSGAGLQCRAIVGRLQGDIDFTVLTTTADRSLPVHDVQDGVPVHRVYVDPESWLSKAIGAVRFTAAFLRTRRRFGIMHLHGFSQKSVLLVWLGLAAGKKIAIKMTSVGDDDPVSLRRRGALPYWSYRHADAFFAVSPRFRELYTDAGLPDHRFHLIPNGVNLDRFRPPADGERESLRHELSIPEGSPVVLFVGFFSREKRPDLLFETWATLAARSSPRAVLVLVGATRSPYYEIDDDLAGHIRRRAGELGLDRQVLFVERTHEIERFQRAADVFVLPSVREGLPNALLEAMASGAACIATRIEGVTDRIIEDGRNGLLVPPDDGDALTQALARVLGDPALRARLGSEARRTIEGRYSLEHAARRYLDAYRLLLKGARAA